MKFMLIALNLLLAAAVAHLAWTYSSQPLEFASTSKKTVPAAKLEKSKKNASARHAEKAPLDSPDVTEKKIAAVLEHNIFKTERVPDAPANKTAQRNNQQIRADMTLVGTYVIGDALGAIILQRLQGNAQQQLKALQQKEYEQYALSSTRVTDPKKRGEAAANAAGEDGEAKAETDGDDQDKPKQVVIMGNPTISANNVFRQHLRIGDTTVNGYKLEEVTRTSAVLTKNNERIELSLVTPSEAGNIARQRQQNNNNKNQQNNNNNKNNNNNNNNRNNNNARNNNNNRNNNNRNNNRDWEWF